MTPSVATMLLGAAIVVLVAGQNEAPKALTCEDLKAKCIEYCTAGQGDPSACEKTCEADLQVCKCVQANTQEKDGLKTMTECKKQHKSTPTCDIDNNVCMGSCQSMCNKNKEMCSKPPQ